MKYLLFLLNPLFLFSQNITFQDSLLLKSGQIYLCKVLQLEEKNIKLLYGAQKEITVFLNGVDKLYLDPIGLIYTNELGYIKDISLLQNIIDKRYSSTIPAEIQVNSLLEAKKDTLIQYNRSSFLLQFWGPEVLGLHWNINFTNRYSINFGLGLLTDIHIGANIYLADRSKSSTSFYIGSQFSLLHEFKLFGGSGESQLGIYIPVGIEYMAQNGFTFQLDVGPNIIEKDWDQTNTKPYLASLKIGYSY